MIFLGIIVGVAAAWFTLESEWWQGLSTPVKYAIAAIAVLAFLATTIVWRRRRAETDYDSTEE